MLQADGDCRLTADLLGWDSRPIHRPLYRGQFSGPLQRWKPLPWTRSLRKTYTAFVKDAKNAFTVLLDPRVLLLMLQCHLTPHCIVDLNTIHMKWIAMKVGPAVCMSWSLTALLSFPTLSMFQKIEASLTHIFCLNGIRRSPPSVYSRRQPMPPTGTSTRTIIVVLSFNILFALPYSRALSND